MGRVRLSIASPLAIVLSCGLIMAAFRSGSDDRFKPSYTLTAIILSYAAIATEYRGASWFGFAILGRGYFVLGFGPRVAHAAARHHGRAVIRNFDSSVILCDQRTGDDKR